MTTFSAVFNENETERLGEISHEYTSYCHENGKKPPDDPLRCLLGYFECCSDMLIAVSDMLDEDRRTATLKAAFPDLIR